MESTSHWISQYSTTSLRRDIAAGITLAAFILPAALADASIANLAPEAGLYACIFSGLVFWIFCSSRHTAITVTSGLSILIGSSLGEMAKGDATLLAAMAACTALMVGVLALIAWIVKAGVVVNFISETVLVGFKFGIALVLISTQLPKLCGFSGSHGSFWERIGFFLEHLNQTNPTSLMIGCAALVVLALGKVFLKNAPVALIVLIAGIYSESLFNLSAMGVKTLGAIPQGLPSIGLPAISIDYINELLPLAMACFLLGSVETVAIGRMFALKHNYRFEPNREFLALGWANIAAGLGRGFPISGGMSQSLVNESARAHSPLSGLFAALTTLLVALYLSGLLQDLPQPVLAAIVLIAVTGLIKIKTLIHLWQFNRAEFLIAIVAVIGVLGSGILRGVLIGAILSLLMLIGRASRPQTVELGRVAGSDYFSDRIRHPENERTPNVFVFRSEGGLLYFNVEYVRDRFYELLKEAGQDVRLAVFYLGTVPIVDLAGVEMLTGLHEALKARGIELRLAETRGKVREALRRGGFEKHYGPVVANQTVTDVIKSWREAQSI